MDFANDSPLGQLSAYFDTVVSQCNLGEYVNKVFSDLGLFQQVVEKLILEPYDNPSDRKPTITLVPSSSLSEFWIGLNYFDITRGGKNGFYPQNSQFALHWREFLGGYRPTESVETKFPFSDSSRALRVNSIGFMDGQTKVLIMVSILAMCHELEWTDEQLSDPAVVHMLKSFRWVRCSFTYFSNPAHHHLHSLKVGHITAEKQSPSAIQFYADLKEAIALERRLQQGSKPLKDILSKMVADYNRMVTVRSHRIDTNRRNMAYNLLRAPPEFHQVVHAHYDVYKHSQSGITLDILALDFWVPGSCARADAPQYKGKEVFREILEVTEAVSILYVERVTQVLDLAGAKYKCHFVIGFWENPMLDNDLSSVMRAGEPFDWKRINFVLEVRGQTVESFISQSQDRQRNAMQKSVQAAFRAWQEQLASDQVIFEQQQIMLEKSNAKTRAKLVRQLEEQHHKAWKCVKEYLSSTLRLFPGKSPDAVSTVMPELNGWIEETLSDIAEVQSALDHGVILWVNLPSVGILSAHRLDWVLTYLSNTLNKYKKNGMAIVIHANRAGQVGGKDQEVKSEVKDEDENTAKKEEDTDDDDEDEDAPLVQDADVRDVRYQFEKSLSLKERNLLVRPLSFIFDPESVYGKRDGLLPALAVVSKADKNNQFVTSKAFKMGCVHGIQMLPRNQMVKQNAPSERPHLGRAMTDVQEMRQVAGGTDLVRKALSALAPQSMSTLVLVDVLANDGWPALAALEENTSGSRLVCGSVALDTSTDELSKRLANSVYDKCRAGSLSLQGFPSFDPLVQALRNGVSETNRAEYQVCAPVGDGKLAVLQSYAQKFLDDESTSQSASDLIHDHNNKFNVGGEFLREEQTRNPSGGTPAEEGVAIKKIKVETGDQCSEADISGLPKPLKININNTAELLTCGDGSAIYVTSKGKNDFVAHRELFSFGSGEWREAAEASEVTACADGRWFAFSASLDLVCILEKKTVPEHLMELSVLDRPVFLRKILAELEDHGEVGMRISHHTMTAEDPNPKPEKALVFVLDEVKDEPEGQGQDGKSKKRKRKSAGFQPTAKNFGSRISINKVKSASKIVIGWRCRLESIDAGKKITPIRPVACLAGSLSVEDMNIRLM
ncbi:unnamed protein product [Cladocopium goreaui]|uniref:Uncharacterized protein n=1 Tax=Cladocopium goreaui TaxID=2562237 RepID=A0A9P1BSL8_9DINO|nr:unnamed protein product [Cladocopium goreaui]